MVSYSELESLYDDYLSHDKFSLIEVQAERLLQNPELDPRSKQIGNWSYNIYFLSNYFDRPKGMLFQTFEQFTILVCDKSISLNLTNAPNFRDRHAYLKWLHSEIEK